MAKRKRSQDENLQPQYKTYVSDKIQQQNNATKMRVIYGIFKKTFIILFKIVINFYHVFLDKTTSMLFNGVKNLSKIENNNNQEKNVNNKNNPETVIIVLLITYLCHVLKFIKYIQVLKKYLTYW